MFNDTQINKSICKMNIGVYEVAQQVKALAATPDELSSVPQPHVALSGRRELTPSACPLTSLGTCTHTKYILKNKNDDSHSERFQLLRVSIGFREVTNNNCPLG